MKTAKSKIAAIAGIFLMLMPFSAVFAEMPAPGAYGLDTIAGYSTVLSTSQTSANSQGLFYVKKPDNSIITIPFTTNQNGIGKVDLSNTQTQKAGSYAIVAQLSGQNNVGQQSFFTVSPDTLSLDASTITAKQSIAKADGHDVLLITVHLQDSFGNPLSRRTVTLLSSRAEDQIQMLTLEGVTDNHGDMVFSVSSNKPGISNFSAFDITSNNALTAHIQGNFIEQNTYLSNAGGDDQFMPVALASDVGQVYSFDISELPDNIQPNQNVSFRVTAQDQNKNTVQNYTGTVHISADSQNVALPQDYTFAAEDLGTHQFSLGLKFNTTGTYKVTVTDVNNQVVKGEKSVTVGSQNNTQQSNNNSGTKPAITTPTAGTFSQNIQTISGKAPAGSNLKIFDNDQEIGTVQTSPNGTFSFQTNPLADGKHKMYIAIMNNDQVQATSDTVEFSIDTTPPQVDDIKLTPETITPGTIVQVAVLSEPNLQQAALVFKGDIIPLSPSLDQDNTYVGSLQAPTDVGTYPVDVVVVDQLGNQATYQGKINLVVVAGGTQVQPPPTQQSTQQATQESTQQSTQESQPLHGSADEAPAQVVGVIGYGSNKKVTLVWEATTDKNNISHYRIHYGLDPAHLSQVADTKDASATWYIPNLENGKEYYFAITAVNNKGIESTQWSEVTSAIPFNLEVTASLPQIPQKPLSAVGSNDVLLRGAALEELNGQIVKGNRGPEIIWFVGASGFISGAATFLKARKKKK